MSILCIYICIYIYVCVYTFQHNELHYTDVGIIYTMIFATPIGQAISSIGNDDGPIILVLLLLGDNFGWGKVGREMFNRRPLLTRLQLARDLFASH